MVPRENVLILHLLQYQDVFLTINIRERRDYLKGTLKPLLPQFQSAGAEDYLLGAQEALKWLDSRRVDTEEGSYWSNPEKPNEILLDIYSGSAGIILFYLEYAKATGHKRSLERAKAASNFLIHYLDQTDLTKFKPGLVGLEFPKAQWSFNAGYSGICFSLIELTKVTNDSSYAAAAHKATQVLIADAEAAETGIKWSGYTAILADSGILLYLLYAADYFQEYSIKQTVKQVGDYFLSAAIPVDEDKIRFEPFDTELVTSVFGLKPNAGYEHEFPNFEYGTAGTAFILAKVYEWGQDERYLQAAIKAANYVRSLKVEVGQGVALIPLSLPDLPHLFYVGYCYGPVGSSRVFQLLYELTQEEAYIDDVKNLARGIIATRAPELHSNGYWRFHGQCCGAASFIELFINTDKQAGDEEFLEYALRSGDKLLSEAFTTQEGARWPHSWGRLSPQVVTTDLGYFDGAAGIGSALLHLYSHLENKAVKIYMPDDTTFSLKED